MTPVAVALRTVEAPERPPIASPRPEPVPPPARHVGPVVPRWRLLSALRASGSAPRHALETASSTVTGFWFGLSALVLVGIAPLAVLAATTPVAPHTGRAWQLALLLVLGTGLRFAWVVETDARRLYEVVLWLFVYVFLGLAPLVQLRSATFPSTTPDTDRGLDVLTMVVVLVGVAAIVVGLLLAGRRPARDRLPVRDVSPHRAHLLSWGALVLSAGYVYVLGAATLFASRDVRSSVDGALWPNPAVGALGRALVIWPLVVCFVALMRLRRQRAVQGQPRPLLLPVLTGGAVLLLANPVSTPRYITGTAYLAVAVALGVCSRPGRARVFALALAAGLVLVFPFADFARYDDAAPGAQGGVVQALTSGDFDAFHQINNALDYVRDEGLTGGAQLDGALLFAVPRELWPDKPEDTGILLAEHRDYDFTNLSAPLWAEFYVDGGWPLLVLGMIALGYLVRVGDERERPVGGTVGGRGVLAVVLPFYLVILLRGSLLQAMAALSVILVMTALLRKPPGWSTRGRHGHH